MERYSEIFRHLPTPALILDADSNILETNAEADKILARHALDEWCGANFRESARRFIDSGMKNMVFERTVRNGGEGQTFRIRVGRIDSGAHAGLMCLLATDITEHRNLIYEYEKLARVVESASDAVVSVSGDGGIYSWNHAAAVMFGYEEEDLQTLNVLTLFAEGVQGSVAQVIQHAKEGVPSMRYETLCRHKLGYLFPVSATFSPYHCCEGVEGISIIARDISSRRESEELLRASHEKLQTTMNELVASLSAIHEKRDYYTSGHQKRVTSLCCLIADELNLSKEATEGLRIAAQLHDIGKVCIPMAILAKPAKLLNEEFGIIKRHPDEGYDILKNIPFQWPVAEIVRQHHERLDGSGYPRGLSGASIMLPARILAVADVVEAMSAHRPYRPSLGLKEAMREIKAHRGTLFDASVCDAVREIIRSNVLDW
jgi:PAS domain S-box-containing protein